MNEAEELLDELFDAVVSGNIQKARKIAEKAIGQGLSADVDAYTKDAWDCVRNVRNLLDQLKVTSHAD